MLNIRQVKESDYCDVAECIQDVYSDTYCRREIYSETSFKEKIRTGEWVVFIIDKDAEAAGIIGFLRPLFHNRVYEFGLYAVKKKYRLSGIGTALFDYASKKLKRTGSVAYTNVTTLHTLAQKLVETRTDFKCVGFLFAAIHEGRDNPVKETLTVHVLAQYGRDCACIFIPPALENAANFVYGSLGTDYKVKQVTGVPLTELTSLQYYFDNYSDTLYINVERCGADLLAAVMLLENKYRKADMFSIILYLNAGNDAAVNGFQMLSSHGYLFSGFMPIYYGGDYIIMYKLFDAPLDLNRLAVTPKTQTVLMEITGERT